MRAEIVLTPKELEDIVRIHLSENLKTADIKEISFEVGMGASGYGQNERDIPMIKSVRVKVEV